MFGLAKARAIKYEPKCVIVASSLERGRLFAREQGVSQMRTVIVTPANVTTALRGLADVEVRYADGRQATWTDDRLLALDCHLAIVASMSRTA